MKKCFIIMPITTPASLLDTYAGDKDHFIHVLDHLFIPALKKLKIEPVLPLAQGSDIIHGEIIKNIETAEMLLCDISTLNPNVFFELGIRTAVNKPVCIVKDDVTEKVPFDTTIINNHTYIHKLDPWTLDKEIEKLAEHIKKSIDNSNGVNSLWKYFSLSIKAEPVEGSNDLSSKIDFLSLQMNSVKESLRNEKISFMGEKSSVGSSKVVDHIVDLANLLGINIENINVNGAEIDILVKRAISENERTALLDCGEGSRYILSVNGCQF